MKKKPTPSQVTINATVPYAPETEAHFAALNQQRAQKAKRKAAFKASMKELRNALVGISIALVALAAFIGFLYGCEAMGNKWRQVTQTASQVTELRNDVERLKFEKAFAAFAAARFQADIDILNSRVDALNAKLPASPPNTATNAWIYGTNIITSPVYVTNLWMRSYSH